MPRIARDGTELYYETAGRGETVAFVPDVGFGAWQWGWQHAALTGPYETLTWDCRGTGRSDAPAGPYAVETLAADLEAVLSAAGADRAHLVGAGLGGLVALAHAREYGRAASLTVLGTAADGSVADPMALFAPREDPDALRETTLDGLSAGFADEQSDVIDGIVEWRAAGDADAAGWRAQAAAVRAFAEDALYEITTPALVIHGRDDSVWPVEAGEELARGLPRGEFQGFDAGHLVWIERSRPVNDHLLGFLDEHARGERG